MATVLGIDHKVFAISGLVGCACVTSLAVYKLIQDKQRQKQTNVYETEKLVSEYLVFHYGSEDGIPLRALDIGCAVGRSTFELSRTFEEVIGIDYSQAFVDVCNQLREDGERKYAVTDEGDLTTQLTAVVPSIIDKSRTSFQQGDACNLSPSLGQFGCVLAANLICRLHKPFDFLASLPSLVAPGGILVITSPYTWLEQFTKKSTWLGGYLNEKGTPVTGFDTLKDKLSPTFDLVDQTNIPFFIRETARKNQWTVAHTTVWRRKTQ